MIFLVIASANSLPIPEQAAEAADGGDHAAHQGRDEQDEADVLDRALAALGRQPSPEPIGGMRRPGVDETEIAYMLNSFPGACRVVGPTSMLRPADAPINASMCRSPNAGVPTPVKVGIG